MNRLSTAVLTALTLGAMAFSAVPGATAATDCTNPQLKTLERVGGRSFGDELTDFGKGELSVGRSGNQPAYWTGTTGHLVPGLADGTVEAVNQHGLMVGTVWDIDFGNRAFAYRAGGTAATMLPMGTEAVDVNDRGLIIGTDTSTGKAMVWRDGRVLRELPAPAGMDQYTPTAINNDGTIVGTGHVQMPNEDGYSVGIRWPADGGAASELGPRVAAGGVSWKVTGLDENGRAIGTQNISHLDEDTGGYWDSPYTADATMVPGPTRYEGSGSFTGISRHTGLIVGYAKFPNWGGRPDLPSPRATVWPGYGPVLTLPPLAEGFTSGGSAAKDNGSVGGWTESADGLTYAAIWTCALQQAE